MLRGLFVTGTDTNVGKTVTCAALLHRYRHVAAVGYWKPIQTGIEQDDDTAEVCRLAECNAEEVLREGIRLRCPVSPHLAARWSGTAIFLDELKLTIGRHAARRSWIIEGAGGALVPINDREFIIDLMRELALPVLVAARSTLGTINHTLLTIEALRARALSVAGVVMVGERNGDNRAAIERYGGVPVLGEIPPFSPLDGATLGRWATSALDVEGHLTQFMR
jgi:dethiobiotin synthase